MLYDKVTPFAGLYTYNDTDNNISKASLFKQALSELYRTSGKLKFESSESLENRLKASVSPQKNSKTLPYYYNVVKMGVINTPISYLNYNPEFPNDGGVKLINGVYVAANNLPPFLQKQVTMISPLEELAFTKDNTITYQFNTTEMYQWGNKKIASMTADFGNGVTYSLIQNQLWVQNSIAINYSTINENKKLIFNIIYTDGTTLTTYAGISIGNDTTVSNNNARIAGTTGLSNHISTIADSNGALGQLEYRIFYGVQNTNNILKKPFIIVDGFDPGDKRKIVVEDCGVNCQKLFKPFNSAKYESIEVLMKYNNQSKDLKAQLTALNYDVIIVNFPTYKNNLEQVVDGGADDIFRNGRTVASFLQKINADIKANGSTEKLVLVGPSMGGQITRYALAYMEKKQQETGNVIWNHNTRIYLSMDSPHQGASIPLAIQGDLYFLGELMEKDDAKSKYRDVINSKAARQMLLTIAGSQTNFYNTDHDIYNQELISNGITGSKGYPVLNGIRKLAIANGSINGVRNVNPSEKFYEVAAFVKIRSILTLGIRIAKKPVFRINNWFMPNKNSTSTLLQNFSQEPSQTINWNLTNNLWQSSLDAVPGGSFNSANDLKDEVYNSLKETNGFTSPYGLFPLLWTGEKLIVEQRIPNSIDTAIAPQAFIPTHSALDTSGFSDWYQPIDRNLVCTGQTPFNSFYGENTNMGHITFTDNMVKWLLEELKGKPQAPSFPMKTDLLGGASIVCLNSNEIYKFQFLTECDLTDTPKWSVSPNLQIVSSTATSVTVKGITFGNGNITATFQNGESISRSMKVGAVNSTDSSLFSFTKSPFSNPTDLYGNVRYGGKIIFNVDVNSFFSADRNSKYVFSNFKIGNVSVNVTTQQIATNHFTFWVPQKIVDALECPVLDFTLTVTSSCGDAKNISGSIAIKCLPTFPIDLRTANPKQATFFRIFPNPSSNIINISLFDETMTPSSQTPITAILYDLNGQEKRSIAVVNNTATINVSHIKKGIYVLKINIDGVTESHQVIVE